MIRAFPLPVLVSHINLNPLFPFACRLQGPTCSENTIFCLDFQVLTLLLSTPPASIRRTRSFDQLIPAPTIQDILCLLLTQLVDSTRETLTHRSEGTNGFFSLFFFPASSGFLGEGNYGATYDRKTVALGLQLYVTAYCYCRDVSVRFSCRLAGRERCECVSVSCAHVFHLSC